MRFLSAIVALCAAYILYRDDRHARVMDPRRASKRAVWISIVVFLISGTAALARPSPYPGVTQFVGDRYGSAQLGPEVIRGMKCPSPPCARGRAGKARYLYRVKKRDRHIPVPRPRPGSVDRLSGVVAPLAAKAREIVANCGSEVISGVRHTYIAGTGGRLSLHASGRAVDIKGNPACIRSHLAGWPGGASTDYAAVNHTHISYAPGGPEWGMRFQHYTGKHRHRHRHHRRRS